MKNLVRAMALIFMPQVEKNHAHKRTKKAPGYQSGSQALQYPKNTKPSKYRVEISLRYFLYKCLSIKPDN
ncbi:MAG: hypothetical protein IT262_08105 [Saprospiraceae bacterium]|nr:hypothetical protein [Saprospiraceae bacterium]